MADATRFQVLSKQIEEQKQATGSISTQIEKLTQSQAQIDRLVQSQQKMEAMMATLISQTSIPVRPPSQPPDPPDCKSHTEFPKFDGTLVREWFRRCDQYFYLHKTPPEMRVRIATPHMIGKALQWHTNYIRNNFGMFPPWLDYTIAISAEFGDEDVLLMHQSSLSPYQNQYNQSHYKIPNTTSLLPPLETTKALPYKPNLPTETNMENSPRKLSHEEIQESEMRVRCESSDGSYANGHHLESEKSHVFVKGCEVASMSGDEANYKTNSVLEKETFPSSELCQRVPATQLQGNNVIQQEEVPILSLEPSQFDVTTIADVVWIAKRCESSFLQHLSATKSRAPFSPYQNYNNQPYYEAKFGKCPEIEFDRKSEEVEDDELKDKQPEENVETLVMNEDKQPLECDDEKNAVTSSILCDRQAVLETEKKIEVSDSTKTNYEANFSGLFSDCKDSFRESEEQHLPCQLVLEVRVGGHETDVLAINERADKDDGPNMQVCFVHDVECISRFFRKMFNMCFQEKRDASDQTTVEVDMHSTSLFYSITKDVDAQGRELEARGFTRKEQNDLDEFVKGGLEKAINERKDIKTILVLLAMGFNEDKWKLFYLVKDYGDGGGITLLRLPLNSSDAFEKIRKGELKVADRTQNHACGVDTRCLKPNCYVLLCLCILLLRRVKRQYTSELLDEFECLGCTYVTTPVEMNVELLSQDDGVRHNASFYRKVFGKLIYMTVSLMIVTGFKQIIWSGNSKTVAATEVNQNSETSQDYYLLLFLERVKATFEIKFTMEQSEKPLITILSYEWFHLPRPPELSCCKEDEESTTKFSSLRTRML